MNINKVFVKNLPVLYIEEFYSQESVNVILNSMIDMNPYDWHKDGSKTGGATCKGESLKHNYCLLLDNLVSQEGRKYNPIIKNTRNIFNPEILELFEQQHTFFSYLKISNSDTTLLNYYEGDAYYNFHQDVATITAVSSFYKTPQKHTKGEFIIENQSFKLKTGSMLLFPSVLQHKASQAICEENGKCNGRFSVAQLIVCK